MNEYNREEDSNLKSKIKNRNNILTWILVFTVIIGTILVIIFNDFVIDMTSYDFSDLLATALSFFAIYISISFYHNAQKSSIQFYSQIYDFIRDITKNIASLDSSVKEQLKGLKESVDDGFGRYGSETISKEEYEKLSAEKKESEEITKDLKEELSKTYELLTVEKENKQALADKIADLNSRLLDSKIKTKNIDSEIDKRVSRINIYWLMDILDKELPAQLLESYLKTFNKYNAYSLLKELRIHKGDAFVEELRNKGMLAKKTRVNGEEIFDSEVFRELVILYRSIS